MSVNLAKPTRADLVRRRRFQQSKRRFEAASRAATTALKGPLVSQPRRVGMGSLKQPAGRNGRQGIQVALRWPALPYVHVSWRGASFSLVLLLGAMLARLLTDQRLFIDGINLGGAALVPGEEIYARSGVAGEHIFWVDPSAVQSNVEAVPGVAAATVAVEWPNSVTILVTERIPVVTWLEHERRWWVDAEGEKFKARDDLPGLLPITVDDAPGKASEPGAERVPVEAIHGALQLRQLRPNIELLHYDAQHGLSYQDGRGWRGYFGLGADMSPKLAVYETLVESLLGRGIQPGRISVEHVNAPYYVR